jgi:hypothetical protein
MKALMLSAVVGLLVLAGCAKDRPHDYGHERPPVGDLTRGDRGLQSKDVIDASDALAQDLLADPKLNASATQWTLVVTGVENMTADPRFNYDIFVQRLKVNLAKYGANRIALIENRDRLRDLRNREWEPGRGDEFGQTGGASAGAGIQPRYALYARMSELPNRQTSYYFCEFNVTDMATRQIVWSRAYEVKTRR